MSFPVPEASTSESADAQRDEAKHQFSPASSFFAQSQAILTAVDYFEPLNSGYAGAARKHKNRTRSALFAQLMANFEFAMKDFVAQTLDATHVYDDAAGGWKWLEVSAPSVLSSRGVEGRLGAFLIHPTMGWQKPEMVNVRYLDVYSREPIAKADMAQLRMMWIVRHAVAHNGGIVTPADARRLNAPALRDKQVLIDRDYLARSVDFLRTIVERLETLVGAAVLTKWFSDASSGSWAVDEPEYRRVKLLCTCVRGRTHPLPAITEAMYQADGAARAGSQAAPASNSR